LTGLNLRNSGLNFETFQYTKRFLWISFKEYGMPLYFLRTAFLDSVKKSLKTSISPYL